MAVHARTLSMSTKKAILGVIAPTIPAAINDVRQPVTDGIPFGKRNQNVWVAFQGTANDVGFTIYGLFNNVWFRIEDVSAAGLLNAAPVVYSMRDTMFGFERLFVEASAAPGGTPEYSFLCEPKI